MNTVSGWSRYKPTEKISDTHWKAIDLNLLLRDYYKCEYGYQKVVDSMRKKEGFIHKLVAHIGYISDTSLNYVDEKK